MKNNLIDFTAYAPDAYEQGLAEAFRNGVLTVIPEINRKLLSDPDWSAAYQQKVRMSNRGAFAFWARFQGYDTGKRLFVALPGDADRMGLIAQLEAQSLSPRGRLTREAVKQLMKAHSSLPVPDVAPEFIGGQAAPAPQPIKLKFAAAADIAGKRLSALRAKLRRSPRTQQVKVKPTGGKLANGSAFRAWASSNAQPLAFSLLVASAVVIASRDARFLSPPVIGAGIVAGLGYNYVQNFSKRPRKANIIGGVLGAGLALASFGALPSMPHFRQAAPALAHVTGPGPVIATNNGFMYANPGLVIDDVDGHNVNKKHERLPSVSRFGSGTQFCALEVGKFPEEPYMKVKVLAGKNPDGTPLRSADGSIKYINAFVPNRAGYFRDDKGGPGCAMVEETIPPRPQVVPNDIRLSLPA